MIHPLVESDFDAAIQIVNRNWKNIYVGYVNQGLLKAIPHNEVCLKIRHPQLIK